MVSDTRGLLFAETEKCFLNDFTCAFDVTENPRGIANEVALILVQRGHDPCGFRRVFHPCLTSSNVRKARLLDMQNDPFVHWFEALEHRHMTNLNFPEVRRAIQALSSIYVERRNRIDTGAAFTGAGKRAAFAMYFAPLHFLLVREIVRQIQAHIPANIGILDLGCGTGAAGAAWALELTGQPRVLGLDRNSWALQECRWTYEQLGVRGTPRSAEIGTLRIPAGHAVIAAFTMNELDTPARDRFRRD